MNEERLVDIETKMAFQEHTIKELNDVVIDQQQQIDQLKSTCKHLVRQMNEAYGTSTTMNVTDDKPPHY